MSANYYRIRIHSANTQKLINELFEKFKVKNDVLNLILDRGAPLVYAEVFGKKTCETSAPTHQPSVGRELKELRHDLDDIYVLLEIFEPMIAALFNLAAEQLDGETVNAEELRSGALGDLPEDLAAIKDEIVARHSKRKGAGK